MTNLKTDKLIFVTLLVFLTLLSIWIQSFLLPNWDASFLLYSAQKFLTGGNYTYHFFETNPPMILYLYIPPIILGHFLSIVIAFKCYIFLIAFFSILICFFLFDQFLPLVEKYFLTLILLAIYLILPVQEFGQREHITIMFTMPYFLLMVIRLKNLILPRLPLLFLIGIIAGVGFAIKPFFLLPLVTMESYFLIRKRNLFAWFRVETFLIFLTMMAYVASVFVFFPDYLKIVLPIILYLYYPGFALPFLALVLSDATLWISLIVIFYYIFHQKNSDLPFVLLLAMLSFLGVFLWEGTLWYYHFIPALSLGIFLIALLLFEFIHSIPKVTLKDALILTVCFVLILNFPVTLTLRFSQTYANIKEQKQMFFDYAKNFRGNSLYFMSTNGDDFPVIFYHQITPASRFPSLWPLPGLLKLASDPATNKTKFKKIEKFFMESVAEDLAHNKPQWILIDTYAFKDQLHLKKFDYIAYFSRNPAFQTAWGHYHYFGKIPYYLIYRRNELER